MCKTIRVFALTLILLLSTGVSSTSMLYSQAKTLPNSGPNTIRVIYSNHSPLELPILKQVNKSNLSLLEFLPHSEQIKLLKDIIKQQDDLIEVRDMVIKIMVLNSKIKSWQSVSHSFLNPPKFTLFPR